MVTVAVFAEGPTEWRVARKLFKKGILAGMGFIDLDKGPTEGVIMGGQFDVILDKLLDPSGKKGILVNPPSDRILLMFDQEKLSNLEDDVISKIKERLQQHNISSDLSNQYDKYPNIFLWEIYMERGPLSVSVHVADKESPDGNKDFDGYVVDLLQRQGGVSIAEKMLKRNHREMAQVVHQIGGQDIPSLMENKRWPINRSKTILYSHITAMQLGKSHVYFSESVVEKSDEQDLRIVFASLIAAWDALKKEAVP